MTGRDNRLLNDRSVTCLGDNLLTHHSVGCRKYRSGQCDGEERTRLNGLGKVKMEMQLFSGVML